MWRRLRGVHTATPRARRLRRASTLPEQRLWRALRGAALGVRFRRQHPIGRYVADFACVERKLVVEVDGGVHAVRTAEDQLRTEALEAMGWCVLRLSNDLVLADMSGAFGAIASALNASSPDRPAL